MGCSGYFPSQRRLWPEFRLGRLRRRGPGDLFIGRANTVAAITGYMLAGIVFFTPKRFTDRNVRSTALAVVESFHAARIRTAGRQTVCRPRSGFLTPEEYSMLRRFVVMTVIAVSLLAGAASGAYCLDSFKFMVDRSTLRCPGGVVAVEAAQSVVLEKCGEPDRIVRKKMSVRSGYTPSGTIASCTIWSCCTAGCSGLQALRATGRGTTASI